LVNGDHDSYTDKRISRRERLILFIEDLSGFVFFINLSAILDYLVWGEFDARFGYGCSFTFETFFSPITLMVYPLYFICTSVSMLVEFIGIFMHSLFYEVDLMLEISKMNLRLVLNTPIRFNIRKNLFLHSPFIRESLEALYEFITLQWLERKYSIIDGDWHIKFCSLYFCTTVASFFLISYLGLYGVFKLFTLIFKLSEFVVFSKKSFFFPQSLCDKFW
jgi:hypothetical protein